MSFVWLSSTDKANIEIIRHKFGIPKVADLTEILQAIVLYSQRSESKSEDETPLDVLGRIHKEHQRRLETLKRVIPPSTFSSDG